MSIHWYQQPGHKNLYSSEIELLQVGLDGDFELTELQQPNAEGRIVATGWLQFEGGKKQPVRIIFPAKYPFSQPKVIPLLASQVGAITDQPAMFQKGNQYIDGAMCLMRKDQWNRSQNIGSILRRAQRWLLRATSPEGFPKDEIVEELPSLMMHIGQVLIPSGLRIPEGQKKGRLVLTQFKPNHYILEHNILSDTVFDLTMGQEVFLWFAFSRKYKFADIFPNNGIGNVLNVLQKQFAQPPESISGKNIALFFPGDRQQWYFFKLQLVNAQTNINHIHYLIGRSIEKELYHRTKDVFDDKILQKKRVTIIGLGALGSEVARSLARNGVGTFHLFDFDKFELGNSVRHAADLYYIGEPKVHVVRKLIAKSNPNIHVNAFEVDILDDAGILEESLANSDICLVLTAEESVDYLINEFYKNQFDIPFVFARVSAGGLSGAVQVVQKVKTACLRCLAKHGADTLPVPNNNSVYQELGPEYGSCSAPAVPGSEIDTKEIALQVSRISLQHLLEKFTTTYARRLGDQYYWHGPFGSKEQSPFTWETKVLEKHPDCELCNP
ncbi:MAG TPA: ThiF family adenylyltransferase [Flavisolibacter sp.]|nr:ThiF family adenylyltransferase [Flavisolibacter sp.]